MIEIKDLLSRFNDIYLSEDIKRRAVMDVLKEVVGLEVEPKDIKIKKDVVYLNTKFIYKNEILLKRDKIFKELEKRLGRKTPNNIV